MTELAEAVGTPFYCYSTATLERHYRVFGEAFAGDEGAGLLRHEGQFQPVGAAHAGEARRRRRRRLRRRIEARAGRRHSAAARSCSPASARPRPSCARRSPTDILCINVESEPELELLSRARGRGRQDRADLGPRQSRRRCRHPRQDRHRQVREQVRHSDRAGARRLCPRRRAAGHRGHRRRHAYRQPDHRSRPDGNRVPDPGGFRRRRCAPTATASRTSISAAVSAFPITWTARRRRCRRPMPRWSSG